MELTPIDQRIYFVLAEEVNRVRIGISADPDADVKEMARSLPVKLRLLLSVSGSRERLEKVWGLFASERFAGLWFNLSNELKVYLETLQSGDASALFPGKKEKPYRNPGFTWPKKGGRRLPRYFQSLWRICQQLPDEKVSLTTGDGCSILIIPH